ncbi:amidohydrolase family protein [Rhodovulum sulfidophilum]|uniref:amidohydrolase family protein n=1 Tax=Rhodovulum sulfidophilum TaxID=35806 RepID=UPI000951D3C2|nr:amidohydrolase family protein [Rhodovulum sulfidophilum]MBL3586831.1 amidohydrolase family protein [Rhodovulum sulfidophilum]MCE8438428.1 amidohydrolase family protein [Rhodovulum sulfidophilum]OLS50735.1 cytosine deaminase [Rhodovulum sulfidophilum]
MAEFDLLIVDGNLPDGQVGDIGISKDRIVAIGDLSGSTAGRVIDAAGDLVSPPFVDPHFHMDATLSYGTPRINASGTLLEGIALWGELKEIATVDQMVERALAYCDWAVSMGLLAIRSHVDTCDDSLKGVEAMLEVREKVRPYLDLQLVAFPQDGFLRDPTAKANTLRALDMGVDVVGGIPHFERTMEDGRASVRELCEIAAERGLLVDLHCDETDDPLSRHVETLAYETQRLGLQGRVNGSHLTSMHSMDNYYVSKLLPLMAEAGLSAVPNPLINIVIQGRHDSFPKRRGLTRVKEMQAHGITVGWGQDCVRDPWYPLGTADMLDVAFMGLHVAQMTSPAEMRQCFEMATTESAKILHLDGYGLHEGAQASLVILDAGDAIEAIRLRPARLAVISKGKVVSETPRADARLDLPGRPTGVRRRHHVN